MDGAAGACVSTLTTSGAEAALTLPAKSKALTVTLCAPSASETGRRPGGPSLSASRYKNTATSSPRGGGRAIVGSTSSGARRTVPSPETSAREARARAWVYVFECYERKKADAESTAHTGKEAKGEKDDRGENCTQG